MQNYKIEFENIKEILKSNSKGLTILEISSKLKKNRNTVAKYLDILLSTGQIEIREVGPAKMYFLSKRVPISALLNFSSDYLLLLDEHKKIIQISEKFLKLLGLSNSIIGNDINSINNSFLKNINLEKKETELLELNLNVGNEIKYFSLNIITTTFYDSSYGYALLFQDITLQKIREEELNKKLKFEKLLIDIATNFINIKKNKIKSEILDSLNKIIEFAQIEIITINLFSKNKKNINNYLTSNNNEYNLNSNFEKDFNLEKFEWWNKKFENFETIYSHYERLPNYAPEKKFLKSCKIESLIIIPIRKKSQIEGFIGFVSSKDTYWNQEHIALLELITKIFEKVIFK